MEGNGGLPAAEYIVECYRPGLTAEQVERALAELRRSAEGDGAEVRCLGALFVAADEAAFHLFAASSAQAVEDVCRRAELDYERVVATSWRAQ